MEMTRTATSVGNNRELHREWIDETASISDKKCGRTAGFEYAIQPDGTCLAERVWRERRQRTSTFAFLSRGSEPHDSNKHAHYQTSSLEQIERVVESKSAPPGPYQQHSETMEALPQHLPKPTATRPPNSEAPFLSPTRRVRNRHNAVFGQHLPNALNSPACAERVFGNQTAIREEQNLCLDIIMLEEKENIQDDNVDDIFMNLDVDKLVAERQLKEGHVRVSDISEVSLRASESTPRSVSLHRNHLPQSPPSTAFYDLCDTSNDESDVPHKDARAPGRESDPKSSRQSRTPSSSTHASLDSFYSSYSSTGNDNEQAYHHQKIPSNHPGQSHDAFQQQPISLSLDSSIAQGISVRGYQQQLQQSSNTYSNATQYASSNSTFNSSNSFDSSNRDYQQPQVSTNGYKQGSYNQQQSFQSSDMSSVNGISFDQSPAYTTSHLSACASLHEASNVPVCPTHNQLCRLLTARSEANAGRQFYKCSVTDHQQACDFFQWADGNETNWNNNESRDWAPPGGDVLDHQVENRRKFGHSSFRPGQQEVIENALKGRDVFVLMPTGGGKSLCYQLPAWCCPGLSVVISPLLSLIQDQVQSMTKLGVQSVFLNSAQDYETEQRDIQRRLFATTAHGGVKLLYITPEKLRHSGVIKNVLTKLHERNHISRFVVDEAHCLR